MKKILIINGNVFTQGGAQVITKNLVEQLQYSYDITILNTEAGEQVNKSIANNCKVINLNYRDNIPIWAKFLRKVVMLYWIKNIKAPMCLLEAGFYNKNYLEQIHAESYDYIIGVEYRGAVMSAMLKYKELTKAKIIGWQHNTFEAYFSTKEYGHLLHEKLFEKIYNQFDKWVVLLPRDKENLDKKYHGIKVVNIPNFVIGDKGPEIENRKDIIISSGRLATVKQFDLLIEAFAKMKSDKYELWILGEGDQRLELEKKIDEYRLKKRVKLLGYQKNPVNFYNQASVFVSTSKYEGFSLVICEALRNGLPVVSFDFHAAKYLSGEEDAIVLVEQDNVEALTMKMDEICENPSMRKELSRKAYRRSLDFSAEKIVEMWSQLLEGMSD